MVSFLPLPTGAPGGKRDSGWCHILFQVQTSKGDKAGAGSREGSPEDTSEIMHRGPGPQLREEPTWPPTPTQQGPACHGPCKGAWRRGSAHHTQPSEGAVRPPTSSSRASATANPASHLPWPCCPLGPPLPQGSWSSPNRQHPLLALKPSFRWEISINGNKDSGHAAQAGDRDMQATCLLSVWHVQMWEQLS